MGFKEAVYQHCLDELNHKLDLLQKRIEETRESLGSETKSSAGDKHETGRAMAQLEMEKLGVQHQTALKNRNLLLQIKADSHSEHITAGSLIKTDKAHYFIAIGLGKVTVSGMDVFVMSPSAPLGQQLIGKKQGDKLVFNGSPIMIEECY